VEFFDNLTVYQLMHGINRFVTTFRLHLQHRELWSCASGWQWCRTTALARTFHHYLLLLTINTPLHPLSYRRGHSRTNRSSLFPWQLLACSSLFESCNHFTHSKLIWRSYSIIQNRTTWATCSEVRTFILERLSAVILNKRPAFRKLRLHNKCVLW